MAYEKKVTKSKFEAVKILLQGGASVKEIGKYLDLSDNTIYVIKTCEKYEDYEQYVAEKIAKSQAARAIKQKKAQEEQKVEKKEDPPVQVVEHRQSVTIQATHYMMEELKKQNELLTLISNKLTFIVEQLQ